MTGVEAVRYVIENAPDSIEGKIIGALDDYLSSTWFEDGEGKYTTFTREFVDNLIAKLMIIIQRDEDEYIDEYRLHGKTPVIWEAIEDKSRIPYRSRLVQMNFDEENI